MKCSICGNIITGGHGWDGSHNADPINDGRCCDQCNQTVVIPARLREWAATAWVKITFDPHAVWPLGPAASVPGERADRPAAKPQPESE
jgi:hypothetical protein